jgi:hypothetical protein
MDFDFHLVAHTILDRAEPSLLQPFRGKSASDGWYRTNNGRRRTANSSYFQPDWKNSRSSYLFFQFSREFARKPRCASAGILFRFLGEQHQRHDVESVASAFANLAASTNSWRASIEVTQGSFYPLNQERDTGGHHFAGSFNS